ncbi:centromere protein C-like isoform X2 [Patiria miniata]|uniref:Centromere protein C n=1 Tax=Patiria miniata TaxID=46514 RepID=A0A913ZXQ0_PATMI|nr:centromere protein C-like isoform X2 [Patiria miniata]
MSAEKERRYQELYKNRFVNPIDQGIGRRTGWVLNKEVRKDSEGFELFDDYWSDSGEESVDDLSLHANKENKGRPYKLSSPIKHMPDFTPSSRASTDVEPLSDVVSKTVTSNSTLTKASNNLSKIAKSVKADQAKTNEEPLAIERENGITREEGDAGDEVTTPGREEGGIQESDITGSIIKGGNSFQVPNSALQEFKTKTRLSFGNDVDDTPKRRSTNGTSSRAVGSQSDDESVSSDTTLKGSQSDVNSDGIGTDREVSAAEAELGTTEKTNQSVVEITSDEELSDKVSSVQVPEQEITAQTATGAPKQKSVRKGRSTGSSISEQQTTTNGHQETTGTTRSRRKKQSVMPVEDDLMSADEGMFISLHKPSASQQDRSEVTVADMIQRPLSDQSFHDADDEEMLEIVDYDHSYRSTLNALKRAMRQSDSSKAVKSVSKTQSRRGRQKKTDKQEGSDKDIVDQTSDQDVPSSNKEITETAGQSLNGVSSEGSGADVEKSKQVQASKTSRSRKSAARNSSLKAVRSSTNGEVEFSTTGSDTDASKRNRSKRRLTKTSQKTSRSDADGNERGSTRTDEDDGRRKSRRKKPRTVDAGNKAEKSNKATDSVVEDNTKTSRRRKRSVRGQNSTDSKTDEENGPVADAENLEESDQKGAQSNTDQAKVSSFKQPPAVSSRKSVQKKRTSVHFSNVEVISDDVLSPTAGNEPVAEKEAINSSPPKQTLDTALDGSSPRKKFKRTPGVKLVQRRSTNRRSKDGEEKPDKMPQKRTTENVREAVSPKRQRGSSSSSVVRGGRKRGGKRKLYSGDLPSSFLIDPSVNDAPSAASIMNADPKTAEDTDNSVGAKQENQTQEAPVGAPIQGRGKGRGRGQGRRKGRGNTRGRGGVRKTQPTREAAQDIQVPDDIVLNFLTKYESGKESESTDSDGGPTTMGVTESSQSDMTDATSSTATPAAMCTTVYPEPTPRSILKGSAAAGIDARKKNLTLQFFEVPKQKPIIVPPDDTENGPRRTRRNRVRPVEYWRNERAEYQRRKSGGFVLVGVQSPEGSSPDVQTQRGRKKAQGPKKLMQTPANLSMHVSPPPGSKIVEHPAMVVMNPDTQQEVEVDTLRTAKMNVFVGPSGKEATPDDPITLCKAISQKAFSSGILTIRPLSEKGMQFVRNDTMVFYITRGKVSVTIHHTTSILQNGDMFFVPQGNMYNIKNLRRDEAKLVFFQHKGR